MVLGDFATGTPIRTVAADATGTVGQRPIPSPDGQRVAYTWQPANGDPVEVRTSRTPTEAHRVVYRARPGDAVIIQDWRVPSSLLLEVGTSDTRFALFLTDIEGTQQHKVADLGAAALSAKHSPDGRFVAYDEPASGEDGRDVVVVPATGGPPSFRLTGLADDFAPGWDVTGDRLLFVSDRAGAASLWSLPIRNGRAAGDPAILQRDIGVFINLSSIASNGTFHYMREVGLSEVFVQALDSSGRPTGRAWVAGGARVGGNSTPTFTPDGKSLVFVSQISPAQITSYTTLAQCDLDTRKARAIRTDQTYLIASPRWSPDGKVLLIRERRMAASDTYSVDAATGATIAPLMTVPFNEDRKFGGARWVDSRTFIYNWGPKPDSRIGRLRRVSIDTLQQDDWITLNDVDSLWDAVPAPTDSRLALIVVRGSTVTVEIREPDGSVHTILTVPAKEQVLSVAWMPGGRSLLFTRLTGTDRTASLWRMSIDEGVPEPLGLQYQGMRDLVVSADGRHLAFTAGYPQREPWVLEHVLPSR